MKPPRMPVLAATCLGRTHGPRKKSNGLLVESVVGKLKYQSPKGRLTYSEQDLKYDLRRGYLKLSKVAGGKTSAKKATEQAKSPATEGTREETRSLICLEDVVIPTGKVAECAWP